jgi:orotidine 5'-phosphate decarboxylase subfamily 2
LTFIDKLSRGWSKNKSLLCVGLDPEVELFPSVFRRGDRKQAILDFNKAIIDATHDLVCAFKPQIAHFAAESAEQQLERTIEYVKTAYPEIPVILDAKRGDIGSTARKYAVEAFDRYGADAVTVNPYLGFDSVEPFLAYKERGVIVLCRTSTRVRQTSKSWKSEESRYTRRSRTLPRSVGMLTATACWWSGLRGRSRWWKYATSWAICQFSFLASGLKAATWKL